MDNLSLVGKPYIYIVVLTSFVMFVAECEQQSVCGVQYSIPPTYLKQWSVCCFDKSVADELTAIHVWHPMHGTPFLP